MQTKSTKAYVYLVSLIVSLALLLSACASVGTTTVEEWLEPGVVTDPPKGYFRVLVAGVDRTSGLADVWMLITLNRDTEEAWILQIPRDTYVAYTQRDYRKLNGAIGALGGMAESAAFLSEALGVSVDRRMVISLDTVARAVDALGGVEIELTESLQYRDPSQGLTISLPKGRQTLDGVAAEQLIRYRSGYAQGDLGRLDMQKVFLSALLRKIQAIHSPVTLVELAGVLLRGMDTDLTLADVALLAPELLRLDPQRIGMVTAPGEATVATVSGASYYVLSREGMAELLTDRLGAEADSFDPDGVFLNQRYPHFQSIYEKKIEARVSFASALG